MSTDSTAGEDQDIEEGEGKWTLLVCGTTWPTWQHPSGAVVRYVPEAVSSQWPYWTARAWREDQTASCAASRDEAERLALGQPEIYGVGDVLTVARSPISTTAAAAPAIVGQTEQARRVQQYAAFRAAVETACPAGFVARTDMVSRPGDEGITAELSRNGRRWREHWAWSSFGAEHQVGGWVARCVAEADREAGERLRRGQK